MPPLCRSTFRSRTPSPPRGPRRDSGAGKALIHPEGPSNQYLRTLVPKLRVWLLELEPRNIGYLGLLSQSRYARNQQVLECWCLAFGATSYPPEPEGVVEVCSRYGSHGLSRVQLKEWETRIRPSTITVLSTSGFKPIITRGFC